jgi:bifunctional ADP-heptose synthase (sugar kinase/adenylyltransferase)
MIVPTQRLHELRGRVAMVSGGFDPIHAGHVAYFRAAADLGSPVLCNISHDGFVGTKHVPLLSQDQRAVVIDAFRDIDYVHLERGTTAQVLAELRPRVFVKGGDWSAGLPAEEDQVCREHGIEIVFLDTVVDSSSALLADFIRRREGAA